MLGYGLQKKLCAVLPTRSKIQQVSLEMCSLAIRVHLEIKTHKHVNGLCQHLISWQSVRCWHLSPYVHASATQQHNCLVCFADIAKLTLIPRLIWNNEIG